jgi:hypothetical protein
MATLTSQLRWRIRATKSTDELGSIRGEPVLEQFWLGDVLKGELDFWQAVPTFEEKVIDDTLSPVKPISVAPIDILPPPKLG